MNLCQKESRCTAQASVPTWRSFMRREKGECGLEGTTKRDEEAERGDCGEEIRGWGTYQRTRLESAKERKTRGERSRVAKV